MKRNRIRNLSLLAVAMVLAMIPQNLPPTIEAEPLTIQNGRGKGIEVR